MKDTLIFEWPGRHHLHPMLAVTILLAALLHGGMFFAFTILYPRTEKSGPNPAHIYFIPPGSPDAARMQGLLRSSDPAVYAPGRGVSLPEAFPPVAYVPRYVSDKPALDPLPAATKPDLARSTLAGPVPMKMESSVSRAGERGPVPTRLVADGELAARVPSLPKETVFLIPAGFDPEPAIFLVSVRGNGQVAHIFLQQGTGDSDLDAQAANLLRWNRFSANPGGMAWGFVTFQWGCDVRTRVSQ